MLVYPISYVLTFKAHSEFWITQPYEEFVGGVTKNKRKYDSH